MNRGPSVCLCLVALCVAAILLVACGADVGDSSAIPGPSGDATTMDGAAPDDAQDAQDAQESGTEAADTQVGEASFDDTQDANPAPGEDGGMDQQVPPETSPPEDADAGPSPEPDSGQDAMPDVAPQDSGVDVGVDAGVDATMTGMDSGPDSQASDATDAAQSDSSDAAPPRDAGSDGAPDVGSDTGSGGGLVPCTTPGQTNCIHCDGNAMHGNVCTPTEALIVERDVAKGFISGNVPDMATSCYECLVTSACIDDDIGPDTGSECGDLTGTVGAGAQASETKAQACLNTLACVLGAPSQGGYAFPGGFVSCGNSPTDGIANCYCGSAFATTAACSGATGSTVNGVCETAMLDGFGFTTATAPSSVIGAITTKSSGSGMADAILKCAGTNSTTPACTMCFQ
jgi:hypothetical protein